MKSKLEPVVILMVEDDPGDQKLVKQALSQQRIGNKLHVTNQAEEALDYLRRCQSGEDDFPMPDLILLDLNMPGMGGKKFLEVLKKDEALSTIPVVVLTTSDSDKDILESFKLQASGYVKKPTALNEFRQVMEDLQDYWFVICRRVDNSRGLEHAGDKCAVGG